MIKTMSDLQTSLQLEPNEYKVISLMRKLPPEQSVQLLTFARFLVLNTLQPAQLEFIEGEPHIENIVNDELVDEEYLGIPHFLL